MALVDGLYQVTTSYLCAGFVVEGGRVTACAGGGGARRRRSYVMPLPKTHRGVCVYCGMSAPRCDARVAEGYFACCQDCYMDDDAHRGEYVAR